MTKKTKTIKITPNFEDLTYTSKHYKPEIIFNPTKITDKADLCFEIWEANEIKGVVPCDKQFMMKNVPVVAGKYREGNNFKDDKNEDGVSIYKLEGFQSGA